MMGKMYRLPDPGLLIGGSVALLVLVCGIFAPWIAPYHPNDQELLFILAPPVWADGGSMAHPLGTDSLGRDTLSRLIYGARTAITVAAAASFGAMLLGAFFAHLAGYFGGWVDWIISRTVEIWLSFPPVVLSMLLITGLGIGIDKVILAIVLVDWTRFCRVLRSEVQVARGQDYVAFARLIGFSHFRVIIREIFPATLPMLITLLSLQMGISVVVEAILSFVAMGVPSDVPAWGQMIADARIDMYYAPWGLALPIFAIFLTVLSFNLFGDGLRRTLDPRHTAQRSA
ncbi:MAG: ABC transporter permease [Alphaproteobacteria bacterium]|nr:ABC transporter permease [Alphaproteobacteria bacterium]MBU1280839.1 ABC transporter permease [Alphaproteobacteria bacterium]MBU1575263.1 ABC transporter permease [Alphaproteobacteria bacterium]MBU1829144.1 ABC transporter permease [Alphaproteobacteria bacterium]MBU2076679.1 ABC transporter permease [Alphaproteobacteria bacterium]